MWLEEQIYTIPGHAFDVVVDHLGKLITAISASVMDGITISPTGASHRQPILRKT